MKTSPLATNAVTKPVLAAGKNSPPARDLRGAISRQDLDKRTTATRPVGKGRSLRGGHR
jgi:hypothetical protein